MLAVLGAQAIEREVRLLEPGEPGGLLGIHSESREEPRLCTRSCCS